MNGEDNYSNVLTVAAVIPCTNLYHNNIVSYVVLYVMNEPGCMCIIYVMYVCNIIVSIPCRPVCCTCSLRKTKA